MSTTIIPAIGDQAVSPHHELPWDILAIPKRLQSVANMLEMLADSIHVRALRREAEENRASGKQDWGRVWIDDWTTDGYNVALDLARQIREASASIGALMPKIQSGAVTRDELATIEEGLDRLHSYLSVLSDSVGDASSPHSDICEVITEGHFSECVSGVMRLRKHLFGDDVHTS